SKCCSLVSVSKLFCAGSQKGGSNTIIATASNCLLCELASGESTPFMGENISVEVTGTNDRLFDSEFVRHAANAVFHYFRYELGRQAVTVAEFASAWGKVISGFALRTAAAAESQRSLAVLESDLGRLAAETGKDSDLFLLPLRRA